MSSTVPTAINYEANDVQMLDCDMDYCDRHIWAPFVNDQSVL